MTANATRTFAALAATAVIALAGISATATGALAKRGGTSYQAWEFETKTAVRGQEGFGGNRGSYCSFRREPQRSCNDRGRCRIVSWRLIQKCY